MSQRQYQPGAQPSPFSQLMSQQQFGQSFGQSLPQQVIQAVTSLGRIEMIADFAKTRAIQQVVPELPHIIESDSPNSRREERLSSRSAPSG